VEDAEEGQIGDLMPGARGGRLSGSLESRVHGCERLALERLGVLVLLSAPCSVTEVLDVLVLLYLHCQH
jgi:hypothetical protein